MNTFQIGDIVIGNNPWLNSILGYFGSAGVLIHVGLYSSIIHLFILNEDITLINDYIDKIIMDKEEKLKIGDLVELRPRVRNILAVRGVGTITGETIIKTSDFNGKWKEDVINAFLVYFSEEDYEYTIPKSCLQLFSPDKND
tara:strand:- start:267 stop:692 length:426 start_codon:yes stop_codon:yes gene_type:complete